MNTTPIDLDAMRNVDIRNVDPTALADIRDIYIDPSLSFVEKTVEYLRQSKGNPYCFRCDDIIVKITHSQTMTTLNDCMESYFRVL